MAKVTFDIHHLARVEGHGNLLVEVTDKGRSRVEMQVTEGTRLFESFLKGQAYNEVSHIMSRICGICSHSHAIAAIRGVEAALEVQPSEETIALRKLMLIGDMLESHALHINFLALPDYLQAQNVVEMLPKYPNEVKRALQLKKLGNDLMELIGGRHTHPLCAVVGGFTHVPTSSQLHAIRKRLHDAIPEAKAQIQLMSTFSEPKLVRKSQYLAVKHAREYPIYNGELTTDLGLQVPDKEYQNLIIERNVPYGHAKFSEIQGNPFVVGALARLNVAKKQLSDNAKDMVKKIGLKLPSYDSFHMNLGQAIEYLHYVDHAIEIIDKLRSHKLQPHVVEYKIRARTGAAAVEAPRGVLIHSYSFNAQGKVQAADVITPTAMNYANIEADVYALVPELSELSKEEAELRLNMLIRAYDPCISCSVHYLRPVRPL
ncbi:MAG: Ni/Fe hydrogenase subunit alpha [Candidatus Hodarchaeota archaeon]